WPRCVPTVSRTPLPRPGARPVSRGIPLGSAPEMDRERFERRLTVLLAVIGGMLAVLAIRLWQIQIVQGEYYLRLAEENRIRVTSITAPRGQIRDRQGRPLTLNRPAFTVSLVPTELQHPELVIPEVARRLGMTPQEVAAKLAEIPDRPYEPVRVRRDVPKEAMAALEENRMDLPGVLVQVEHAGEIQPVLLEREIGRAHV